jgi:O-antigen/teichoic acid export membrane protein
LITKTLTYFKDFFGKGHERTLTAKKNIAFSFLIKGGSIIISMILIPMTINYVSPIQYGIWLTLSSIIGWFGFFDIGLGNGLKNKLAEAITVKDYKAAKTYVSTTYVLMGIISGSLLVLFLIFDYFANWTKLLNAPPALAHELSIVALFVFGIFVFQFVFQLLNVVAFAAQNTKIVSLNAFLGNLLGISIIFILTRTVKGSLLELCLSIGISPVIILLAFSIVMYNSTYKNYSPSFKYVNFKYAKDVLNLGFKFFIIQLGSLFFYNSDNIIISQIIGPQAVTPYNIGFKYFTVITMISGIIMTPFWPAFTEAYVKKDYAWVKKTVSNLRKICYFLTFLSFCMVMASPIVYRLWVGNKVSVPFSLSVVLGFYTCVSIFRSVFYTFTYATGKISLQLIMILVTGAANIPLGIFLGKTFGITGVILSTTILTFLCLMVEITQYFRLINNRATGIWNR